jgi:hypothetical protein
MWADPEPDSKFHDGRSQFNLKISHLTMKSTTWSLVINIVDPCIGM